MNTFEVSEFILRKFLRVDLYLLYSFFFMNLHYHTNKSLNTRHKMLK